MLTLLTRYFPSLSSEKKERLLHLTALYKEWNIRLNLISRRDSSDTETLMLKHILHSLAIAHFYPFPPNTKVLDIGTGGGLPALPLAIFFPHTDFTLCDSIKKKITAVANIITALQLSNAICMADRAENLPPSNFDYVMARGVASLPQLVKWSRPLLRLPAPPHAMLFLKGGDLSKETKGITHHIQALPSFFKESFFEGKYIVSVSLIENKTH